MKSLIKSLKQIKYWQWAFLFVIYVTLISLGVVFNSGALVICNSLFACSAFFFIANGVNLGNVFGIVNLILYCTIAYFNRFYGEIICSALITFPAYCISLFTWFLNRDKDTDVVTINRKVSKVEWILLFTIALFLYIGIYFLLKSLNTANLIVSTTCVIFGGIGGYLLLRRCEYNFIFFTISSLVSIVLWLSTLSAENMQQVTTIAVYFIAIVNNTYGLINWIRMKKNKPDNAEHIILKVCKTKLK